MKRGVLNATFDWLVCILLFTTHDIEEKQTTLLRVVIQVAVTDEVISFYFRSVTLRISLQNYFQNPARSSSW